MVPRDLKLIVTCEICKKEYSFYVNEDAYQEFISEENDKFAAELFPHLMDEEIDLIETNICENCI